MRGWSELVAHSQPVICSRFASTKEEVELEQNGSLATSD